MRVSKVALIVSLSLVAGATQASADTSSNTSQLQSPEQSVSVVETRAPIAEGLSDFEWFRIFPYVDKSYSLAAAGRLDEALQEIGIARAILPEHIPLLLHHAQLLIDNGNAQRAFEVLQPYLADPQVRQLHTALLGRSDQIAKLSVPAFFSQLESLTAEQQAPFASAYLNVHGPSLSKAQLVRLSDILGAEGLTATLSSQLAEYLFLQGGAEEVVVLLEPLCTRMSAVGDYCNDQQRRQLIQAMVISEQFDDIEQLLMPLADADFDTVLQATANRMIGTERTDELIGLLRAVDDQRTLTREWGLVLYGLAVDSDDLALALELAQRYSVNCVSHAELLLENRQTDQAAERLSQCQPSSDNENRYLVLAQRIGEPVLLEDLVLSSSEAEEVRIRLLVDHYASSGQQDELVSLLQNYEQRDLNMQRLLARAFYASGQTEDALAVSEKGWRQHKDVASLDTYTYILLNEQRFADLLSLAVNEPWDMKRNELAESDIGNRLSIGIERSSANTSNEALVAAAQRWPDRRIAIQVSEILIQRQDCNALGFIRLQLEEQAEYEVDSYCLGTPAERLTALEQYRQHWGNDEWLRGAVLAYETGDYRKSQTYLGNLTPEVERGVYQPLLLSALLAMGQTEEAWARWQQLSEPLTEDELMIGVEIALRIDDRTSISAALQRVQRSQHTRTALPLRLRLAEIDGDLEQQLALYQSLAEENPGDPYYVLAQAYVEERLGNYSDAGLLYDKAFAAHPDTRSMTNLQQAAYVNSLARRDALARQQLREIIDTQYEEMQQGTAALDQNQRFYRQVDSPVQVSVAGWLGRSSNVSQVTGNDFQADYFVSTMLEYDLDYGQERRSNVSFFANLLSAGDDFFFDSNTLDIGLAWQPVQKHLSFLRVAARTSFDGAGTRVYVRGSTDLLASQNAEKHWAEDKRSVDQSLYLDWLFFPDEQTSGFYARYQPTFQFGGEHSSFFKIGAYPFVQYQWTNDTIGKQRLTDTRVGLGMTWRQPLGRSPYSGWYAFSEVGIEWQHVLDSGIAADSDNGLLLRFAVYF